ncbi:hypothetical protein TRFO_18090 [Tritrichomonas foetus]|uniref:RING-type domain-containing protein n=1 Tax=Tritrichomonas foetus TaxID=1144522 RepID=A0A1J4KMS0_9EUKA|nr:hypothetical protein TRFO_18090 [Tritrichomonas foetus]|eukprot:OHT12192.1 hypothetical protein TRFO_18090 [Tritrichomonas foetus]
MPVDFLSILNDENSRTSATGEIELIFPEYSIDDDFEIKVPCKIFSKCQSLIKCAHFSITSPEVSIDGLKFITSVMINNSDNFQLLNSKIKHAKLSDGGLYIANSHSVYLSHVTISKTENIPGLYITQNCTISADNLLIHHLVETLLVCNTHSILYVKDSNLHHTSANAVYVSAGSHIEIYKCKLWETEYPAIFIQQSTCRIENNEIRSVKQNGVSLNTVKKFVVAHNYITDVNGSAIAVLDESKGSTYRNTITKVGGNGIYVCGNSEIRAYKNIITDNQFPGIAILMKSNAKLSRNKISKIIYSGICVRGAKKVLIRKCNIDNVQECGISISDTDDCTVRKNKIDKCKIASVEVYNSSDALVKHNYITEIGTAAFLVYAGGSLRAYKNKIRQVGVSMVKLSYKGGGIFLDNDIKDCPIQKNGDTVSSYYFSGNGEFPSVTNNQTLLKEGMILDEPYEDKSSSMCIRCNERPRNCFILDCSHRIFCEECAKQALDNKELCPLCRFPIVSTTIGYESGDDGLCVICSENKADCIIMPCGHMGFCQACLGQWYRKNKTCPTCRAEPSFYKKIIQDL